MAGFRLPKKTYNITWPENHDYAGLEVRAHGVSVGVVQELGRLQEKAADNTADVTDFLISVFDKALISWNLETEDGRPVPADRGGILSQDMELVMSVIGEWMTAITGVSPPLNQPSGSTGISDQETLSLANLSQSLPI